jgi:hypothetical protein
MWTVISSMRQSPRYCLLGSRPLSASLRLPQTSSMCVIGLFLLDFFSYCCTFSFYTRLFKIKDPITSLPVFSQLQVTLVCNNCKEQVSYA